MIKLFRKIKAWWKNRQDEKQLMDSLALVVGVADQLNEDTQNQFASINATAAYRKHHGIEGGTKQVMLEGRVQTAREVHLPKNPKVWK